MDQTIINENINLKIVLTGDVGTGKTSLMVQRTENKFISDQNSTVGLDLKLETVIVENKCIKLQIWDTAGHERFRGLTQSYYRSADGILLIFDLTNEDSFKNITTWLNEIEKNGPENVPILLVGNKLDLKEKRMIDYHLINEIASQLGLTYIETSAKGNIGVKESFDKMIEIAIDNLKRNNNSKTVWLLNDKEQQVVVRRGSSSLSSFSGSSYFGSNNKKEKTCGGGCCFK